MAGDLGPQDNVDGRSRRGDRHATRKRGGGAACFRILVTTGARPRPWLVSPSPRQRSPPRRRFGHHEVLAVTIDPTTSPGAADLLAAVRAAARQEQFLEVVSAGEARGRFERQLDLSPLPGEAASLAEALGRVLSADV